MSSDDSTMAASRSFSSWAFLWSVTSRPTLEAPMTSPSALRMGETVSETSMMVPSFRRRLVWVPFNLGHPVWIEDPDFDLENHVHHVSVRPPGTMHELADVVGDIAGRQLDRSHPLWEMHIIEGLDDGKVAFVTKVHHSAIDGASGAELLTVLLDLSPEGRELPDHDDFNPVKPPHRAVLAAVRCGRVPSRLATVLVRTRSSPW